MNISFSERIILQAILPVRGKFEDLIIREDIINKIKITQEEVIKYEVKTENDTTAWKATDDIFSIEFTAPEMGYISRSLNEINEKGELVVNQVSLYKKFVKEAI